jgi:hypothetical protein
MISEDRIGSEPTISGEQALRKVPVELVSIDTHPRGLGWLLIEQWGRQKQLF